MAFAISKAGYFGQFASCTSHAVPNPMRAIGKAFVSGEKLSVIHVAGPKPISPFSYSNQSFSGVSQIKNGIGVCCSMVQKRMAHTDVKYPDFSDKKKYKTSGDKAGDAVEAGKLFKYIIVGGAIAAPTVVAGKHTVRSFVEYFGPNADAMVMGKIEVNLSKIPEGKSVTFKWRGKPLFVKHRTDKEIQSAKDVDISKLRHPEHDADRVKDDKWLIMLGLCTHLGCVPIPNAGSYGGYFCPCHGSVYDTSGRIREGPAPLNLEVPEYELDLDENMAVIG